MSTQTELTRLLEARNTIRDKLVELSLSTATDKLDVLADAINDIPNRGAVSATVMEEQVYTIPAGYHNGSGTVTGIPGGGNYTLQDKSVTPTKNQQVINKDDGYYGLNTVTVAPIPDAYQNVSSVTAVAADVLATKIIVDAQGNVITGTMPNNGTVTETLDATENNQSYTIPAGYHSGSGAINIVLEEKSVVPQDNAVIITPTSGKVLSKVTTLAIPATYGNTTGDTGVAADVLAGVKVHSFNSTTGQAVAITGTMPNRGTVTATIDGLTTTSYTIPSGYHSGSGTVSLTNDIENALKAI